MLLYCIVVVCMYVKFVKLNYITFPLGRPHSDKVEYTSFSADFPEAKVLAICLTDTCPSIVVVICKRFQLKIEEKKFQIWRPFY